MKKPGKPAAAAALVAAAILAGALFLAMRPQAVFLVEKEYAGVWRNLIDASPDAPRWRIVEFDPTAGNPIAGKHFGYRITTDRSGGSPESAARGEEISVGLPLVCRDLSRLQGVDGALPLAVDPWMVFRRHTAPRLDRDRLDALRKGTGVLLLPGGERSAVWAFTAQEIQRKPGDFPQDAGLWRDRMERLPRDKRFQAGALTYTWEDIWPRLFSTETAWVYAPLSRVQASPGNRTSLLEADRFPEPDGWNEYGIQARILWAVPFGNVARADKRDAAAEWLGKAETQASIAAALKWVPAHRAAKPLNPLAFSAQKTWIESSFVWEAGSYAYDD